MLQLLFENNDPYFSGHHSIIAVFMISLQLLLNTSLTVP